MALCPCPGLPIEPLHFGQPGAGPAGVWEDPEGPSPCSQVSSPEPKAHRCGLCQSQALSKSRLPCHSQFSGPARPAGLRTTIGLSDVRISKPTRAPQLATGVRPQGAFGTRSLDRSSHDRPGGLYNQSPWCWVGGEGRTRVYSGG